MRWQAFTAQSRYKKQASFAVILWTLLIFMLCLWPGDELPRSDIRFVDKWVHFLLFAPFAFFGLCATPGLQPKRLLAWLLAGCFLGFLVECLQLAFPSLGRSYDLYDILADAIGSLLGVMLFAALASLFARPDR